MQLGALHGRTNTAEYGNQCRKNGGKNFCSFVPFRGGHIQVTSKEKMEAKTSSVGNKCMTAGKQLRDNEG